MLLPRSQLRASGQLQVVGPMPSPALDVLQLQRLQHPYVQLWLFCAEDQCHELVSRYHSTSTPRSVAKVHRYVENRGVREGVRGRRQGWLCEGGGKVGWWARGHISEVKQEAKRPALAPAIPRVILQRDDAHHGKKNSAQKKRSKKQRSHQP